MTWLELQEYILENYEPEHGSKTPLDSMGNYDDVFEDGVAYGRCFALHCIARILGMDVPSPDIPSLE